MTKSENWVSVVKYALTIQSLCHRKESNSVLHLMKGKLAKCLAHMKKCVNEIRLKLWLPGTVDRMRGSVRKFRRQLIEIKRLVQ